MSSHREAPEISKDPVADSTDLYAFVSPDQPGHRHADRQLHPAAGPGGGPNFYEFGDDVLYEIHIDNNGDGRADITYQFRFQHRRSRNPNTFLYNTGPITSLDSPNWNRRQFYTVTRVDATASSKVLGSRAGLPAVQHRPAVHARTTPTLGAGGGARPARRRSRSSPGSGPRASTSTSARSSTSATCGRSRTCTRSSGCTPSSEPAAGVNATAQLNVHSIAIQVPIARLLPRRLARRAESDRGSVHRRLDDREPPARRRSGTPRAATTSRSGPFVQVSRLGNPLFNEVLVPLAQQGLVERAAAVRRQAVRRRASPTPSWPALLPALYPGVFPNLAALDASGHRPRRPGGDPADRHPVGHHPGLPELHRRRPGRPAPPQHRDPAVGQARAPSACSAATSPASPTAAASSTTWSRIELRAIAGVTVPLVDKTFTPDAAAGAGHRRAHRLQRPVRLPGLVPLSRRALQRLQHLIDQYQQNPSSLTGRPGNAAVRFGRRIPSAPVRVPAREYNVLIKWRSRPIRSGGGSEEGA